MRGGEESEGRVTPTRDEVRNILKKQKKDHKRRWWSRHGVDVPETNTRGVGGVQVAKWGSGGAGGVVGARDEGRGAEIVRCETKWCGHRV